MDPTPNELKNVTSSASTYASEIAKHVATAVAEKVHQQELKAQEIYQAARERAEDAMDTSVDFVKKHPFSTVAGAAAVGFIAGILLRRNKH
jgi:ElaB/YqjD/DUF883 family membrane-anchored ribosome-binding protein